jgi:arabinofuranosyltransferase
VVATLEHPVERAVPEPVVRTRRRVLTIAVLLIPAVVILWAGWQRRWTADDGFINLRVVRQLLDGHGPVFNAGQRVETGTSTAWVGVLALLDLVTPFRLEWIAAVTGLLSTTFAVGLATFATRRGLQAIGVGGLFLPLGALAYVSVPPAWDFATSGLETGLALLWLSTAWWLLCGRVARPATARVRWWMPVVLGLGVLVRPDFLIFSLAFVVAVVVLSTRADRMRIVVLAAAVPVVTELGRAAWFGSLVPNTALAKEASRSNWSQGWRYLVDFVGTYSLVVPVAILAALVWLQLRTCTGSATRRYLVVSTLVVGGAAIHALYVVKVGGDFMHARLLLPACFAAMLPVAVVVAQGWARTLAVLVVVWAVASMVLLRPPYSRAASGAGRAGALAALSSTGIGDERLFYVRSAGTPHPVTIDDYLHRFEWAQAGSRVRRLAGRGTGPILVLGAQTSNPFIVPANARTRRSVASVENLGVFGYAAGVDVDVVDDHGLADVVAAHLALQGRGRPGHEKALPDVWTFARYAAADAPRPHGITEAEIAAARRALACGTLGDLVDRSGGTWSIGDALGDAAFAARSFAFRVDPDPRVAAREVCSS